MNCSEARQLIQQGITPGSHSALQAELGFHLAGCPDCRAAYAQQHTLPGQDAPSIARAKPAHAFLRGRDTQEQDSAAVRRTMLHRAAMALLVLLPLLLLLWIAGIAIRTSQNLDAMIVATPVPRSTQAAAGAAETMPLTSSTALSPTQGMEPPAAATTPITSATRQRPTSQPPVAAAPHLVTGQDMPDDLAPPLAPTVWPTIQILPSPTASRSQPAPSIPDVPDGAVNILVLGNDRRPGEQEPPRTDVVMLVRVEPQSKRLVLLSLLRDLWVEIPGYGYARVNAAYRTGEIYDPGTGLDLARRTVTSLLDVPIDYTVMVDFQGFIGLIDTLGGITVDVEKELYDPTFPTMDYGYQVAHFVPGPEHMDGNRALMYSRIRHPDSDFMRIRRQQTVVLAMADRLRERGDLRNILAIDQITGALVGYVQTDMPKERMIQLLWAMRDHEAVNVEQYAMTNDMVSWGVGNDIYALVPYRSALDQLARSFLGTP